MGIRRLGAMVSVAAALALAAPAFGCVASSLISVQPEKAAVGDTVAVTGRSWNTDPSASPVDIRLDGPAGRQLWIGRPDTSGALAASFVLPDVEPGFHVVIAYRTDAAGNNVPGTPSRAALQVVGPDDLPAPQPVPAPAEQGQTSPAPAVSPTPAATPSPAAVAAPSPSAAPAPATRATPAKTAAPSPTLPPAATPVVAAPSADAPAPAAAAAPSPAPAPRAERTVTRPAPAASHRAGDGLPLVALVVIGLLVVAGVAGTAIAVAAKRPRQPAVAPVAPTRDGG